MSDVEGKFWILGKHVEIDWEIEELVGQVGELSGSTGK